MITDWFDELDTRTFIVHGEYGSVASQSSSLPLLLHINMNSVKPFTADILNPQNQSSDFAAMIGDISNGINAVYQIVDILPLHLEPDVPIANRQYCYFESLVYLRESMVSWLDKNVLAALTLLRPFLELTLLHIHWHLHCSADTYQTYYEWLDKGHGKPPVPDLLRNIFDDLTARYPASAARLMYLRSFIHNIYTSLCSYNHSPRPSESVSAKSGGLGSSSLEMFFYYSHIALMTLRQLTYLYVHTYPMIVFPVDRYQKWGFTGGPDGLFFDQLNYLFVEQFIGKNNASRLKSSLSGDSSIISQLAWFNSLPSLSSEDLEIDWTRFTSANPGFSHVDTSNATVLEARLAAAKAYNRSMKWVSNYQPPLQKEEEDPSDEWLESRRKAAKDW